MLRKHAPILILITIVIGLISAIYTKPFFNPNSYLFSDNGDGMKNYYTYAYYIKNNSFSAEFEGMNYPYFEQVMYTDCHPFQAYFLKTLVYLFPVFSNYTVGLLNFFLLISFLIATIITFYTLKRLKVNDVLSVLGAIAIVALSPQIFRITGHLALSYSFAIPLTFLLILRFEQDDQPKLNTLLLILSGLYFLFTHAYLGVIVSGVTLLYGTFKFIHSWRHQLKDNIRKILPVIMAGALPILIFYTFTKVTDNHSGRTTNPWGISENHADFNTVFLPTFKTSEKLPGVVFPEIQQTWEGWSYIGFPSILAILILLAMSTLRSWKVKKVQFDNKLIPDSTLRILFMVSVTFLLFSFYIPFRWHLDFLVDYVSIIKQFRAIGRFAWVFYFTAGIMLFVMVNQAVDYLKSKDKQILSYTLMILTPFIMIYESKDYHIYTSSEVTKSANKFDLKQNDLIIQNSINNIAPEKYQAILPLPFYYIGSDNFGKAAPTDEIEKLSFLFSYHLSLPMISAYLTRTSIWESKNIMQIFASDFYAKPIKEDFKNAKPLLIICKKEFLSTRENEILSKCSLIEENESYALYELAMDELFFNNSKDKIKLYNTIKSDLINKDNFLVSDTIGTYYFEDFHFYKNDISRSGKTGSKDIPQNTYSVIYGTDSLKLELGTTYECSFWIYHGGINFGQDQVNGIAFIQEKNGENLEWITVKNLQECTEIDQDWSLIKLKFQHSNKDSSYELVLKGSDFSRINYIIDDLLIRKEGADIFREYKEDNFLFWNNDHIPLEY